MYSDELTDMI